MDTLEKWHGTAGGYSNHKCRCDECRRAWAKMALDKRRRNARDGFFEREGVEHGKYSTYSAGCKCDPCKEAVRRYAHSKLVAGGASREKPSDSICECCGRTKPLVFDHDHFSGEFRGWICTSCNTGLGKLGDNVDGVQRALAYLTKA